VAAAEGPHGSKVQGTGPVGIEFQKKLSGTETHPSPASCSTTFRSTGTTVAGSRKTGSGRRMLAAGLPDFRPVQNNISFNEKAGPPAASTRSLGTNSSLWPPEYFRRLGRPAGRADFRCCLHCRAGRSQAIFIPRGVGNAFQTLEDNTAYVYLVNDHWSADAQGQYTFLNLADETATSRGRFRWTRPSFRTRTRRTRGLRTLSQCRRDVPSCWVPAGS
jgi:hypothetical protein